MRPNLDGITVVDHSTVGPASRCTQTLADLGALVIKIGPAAGDRWTPPWHAYGAGRGTRRARFDLTDGRAREAYLSLAATSDVVVESFRPGVADKLGIGYEQTRALNPGIVYCATTGYGQEGPYAQWAGHDLNYLAVGGFLSTQGARADGGPAIPGATVADSAAGGMHAVIAILAALVARASSGQGQFLDVSATDGVVGLMSLNIDEYLATGVEPGPGITLLTGKYACYDVYRARDGRWLAVGAIEPKFFANLCEALGLSELAEHQMDEARQDELRVSLSEAFGRKDRDEWVRELAGADTCVTPVLSIAEVTRDEHLRARGLFADLSHPHHGTARQVAPVVAGSERASQYDAPDPAATDTVSLLAHAGLTEDEIGVLLTEGVIA